MSTTPPEPHCPTCRCQKPDPWASGYIKPARWVSAQDTGPGERINPPADDDPFAGFRNRRRSRKEHRR